MIAVLPAIRRCMDALPRRKWSSNGISCSISALIHFRLFRRAKVCFHAINLSWLASVWKFILHKVIPPPLPILSSTFFYSFFGMSLTNCFYEIIRVQQFPWNPELLNCFWTVCIKILISRGYCSVLLRCSFPGEIKRFGIMRTTQQPLRIPTCWPTYSQSEPIRLMRVLSVCNVP